jgi:hypothetical protein
MQTPAEVLLRLLLLKHIRNWSYDVLEREVRANLVYRAFTRIGDEKVPDAKTLARLGQLVGPKVIEQLHERVVELAQEQGVTRGCGSAGGVALGLHTPCPAVARLPAACPPAASKAPTSPRYPPEAPRRVGLT